MIVTDQPADAATRRSATCEVMVTLTDENDNIPVFEETFYESSVPEDRPIGRVVAVVTARDDDSGRNGDISYVFLSSTSKLQDI